jgi:BON domain
MYAKGSYRNDAPDDGRVPDALDLGRAEQDLLCAMFGGQPDGPACCLPHHSDAALATDVNAKLADHPAVRSGHVQARVDQRWVVLEGIATTSEWQDLESVAVTAECVAGVHVHFAQVTERAAAPAVRRSASLAPPTRARQHSHIGAPRRSRPHTRSGVRRR